MHNMAGRLNNKAELFGLVDIINELGENDTIEGKIKDVYCNIIPQSATKTNTPVTEGYSYSHKFTVRSKSIENPKLNMFFILKGQKYKIKYWQQDFKNNEFLEIFTELKME